MVWCFGPEACGILASRPRTEPAPLALESEFLTTGPPGKSPCMHCWWAQEESCLYFGNFGFQVTWHLHTREFHWDDIDAMNISCYNLSFWMIGRIRRPQVSESVNRSVVSDSLRPHGLKSSRLLCPWDSPGNNTGVGSHFLLQGSSWPGIEPRSPVLQADSLLSELQG